jgi:hypothetical protein
MTTISKAGHRELPTDFPNDQILGAVSGAQPKLLLRRDDKGAYVSLRLSPEELMHRFECANDLADQLVDYFMRKKSQHPDRTDESNLERIRLGLAKKAADGKWPYTEAEQAWIMKRLREMYLQRIGDVCEPKQVTPDSNENSEHNTPAQEAPIFSTSNLLVTPTRTSEQIRRLIAEGRLAEMTPRQAGVDENL